MKPKTEFHKTVKFSDGEREELITGLNEFHYKPTRFLFVNDHNGFRKGKWHIIMGTSGQGKSTVARSLLTDMAKNHKVLLYSSEETLEETKGMLAIRDVHNDWLDNCAFIHEREFVSAIKNQKYKNTSEEISAWMSRLEIEINNSEAEIFFLDNITTSLFYEKLSPSKKTEFLTSLKQVASVNKIAMVFVAHTKKGVKEDSLITPGDVRGIESLTHMTEHLYAYQKFIGKTNGTSSPIDAMIRVLKGRGISNIHKNYLLQYDHKRQEYTGDRFMDFSQIEKIYKNRVKLA